MTLVEHVFAQFHNANHASWFSLLQQSPINSSDPLDDFHIFITDFRMKTSICHGRLCRFPSHPRWTPFRVTQVYYAPGHLALDPFGRGAGARSAR